MCAGRRVSGGVPARNPARDDRPLGAVDGVRGEDLPVLLLRERAALHRRVELVAPPAVGNDIREEVEGWLGKAPRRGGGTRSARGARVRGRGARADAAATARAIAREGPRASTRGSIRFGRGAPLAVARETHLRRQLLLLRPSRASAMAVQFPGPPSLWICSRRSASSCAVNRRVGRVRWRSLGASSNRAVERRGRGGATPRVAGSEKFRSGKVLTVDAGCSTSIRLRSRGAPRARVRGRAHLRRPGVLHHLLALILRVRHRCERSLSGSCARRAREKCDASRLNGGGVDDSRGVVRSTLRLKKTEAKSAFSFAASERSGVNRPGGVGENPTRSIASRPSFSSRASPFFPATLLGFRRTRKSAKSSLPAFEATFFARVRSGRRSTNRTIGRVPFRAGPTDRARVRHGNPTGARLGSAFFGPRGASSFLASTRRRR